MGIERLAFSHNGLHLYFSKALCMALPLRFHLAIQNGQLMFAIRMVAPEFQKIWERR